VYQLLPLPMPPTSKPKFSPGASAFALLVAFAGLSLPLAKASITYISESAFTSGLAPGHYLNDFDSLSAANAAASPMYFSSGSWSYTASAPSGFWQNDGGIPSSPSLGVISGTESLTITFTGAAVTAVGGNFFAADVTDTPQTSPTVDVVVTFADTSTETISGASAAGFNGIINAIGISQIEIKPGGGGWGLDPYFSSVDHLYVGVPEASSLMALGAGMLLLVGVRRRKP